jgi:hypothetical protein
LGSQLRYRNPHFATIAYGDRDSVGLFQQRASWGSFADRMDPVDSSRMFYQALRKVDGWQEMSVATAA